MNDAPVLSRLFGSSLGSLHASYSCSVDRKISLSGRLYVTSRCLLFYANLFGFEKKIRLELGRVKVVEVEGRTMGEGIAIRMVGGEGEKEATNLDETVAAEGKDGTEGKVYWFRGFDDRALAFNLITKARTEFGSPNSTPTKMLNGSGNVSILHVPTVLGGRRSGERKGDSGVASPPLDDEEIGFDALADGYSSS